MLSILEFIFSSFLHYLGTLVLILTIVLPLSDAISNLGPRQVYIKKRPEDKDE